MSKSKLDKALNFLFITKDQFPPFRVDVLVLFGQEMVARGHRIDWILQPEEPASKAKIVEWNSCRVYLGTTNIGESRFSRIVKHLKDIKNDIRMFRLMSENNYDFIQVKNKFLSALLAIVASKRYKTKLIYWLSYPYPESSIYEARTGTARYPILYYIRGIFFKILLYKVIMKYADHIVVQSEQMKRDVVKENIPENKITAIPMGFSEEVFAKYNIKADVEKDGNEKIILYLGTMLKTRRLDFVIKVFSKVLEKIPDAMLYMVGSGEQESDILFLQQEAERLNVLDKIVFTGRLPQNQALALVKKATVCVSPFLPTPILNSTSPTKLIEYMAMKKSVVANDHPEQSLIINESKGGICVPYKINAFADAIIKILSDPDLAFSMGENGYNYVMKYRTYSSIADKVEEMYANILQ